MLSDRLAAETSRITLAGSERGERMIAGGSSSIDDGILVVSVERLHVASQLYILSHFK